MVSLILSLVSRSSRRLGQTVPAGIAALMILLTLMIGAVISSAEVRASDPPVILLTGFEPFGRKRPPNPSWEAIKTLNDTEWSGHRIVAVQLPVVWGEPIKQIEAQIDSLKPVAVFSFGQGAPGAFAIETRARNQRGGIPDNTGSLPSRPLIAGDGPTEYSSAFPADKVIATLTEKGYSMRKSENAGQYLCEETLYSLEVLKRKKKLGTVAFCHVPPLGSKIGDKIVDATYVHQFVLDYLAAWQEINAEPAVSSVTSPMTLVAATSVGSPDEASPKNAKAGDENPEKPAVEKLIKDYFKSWSDQRMRDYGNCFADDAVIQEVTRTGELYTQMKNPFVTTQATYHKMAMFKAVEVPVKTTITFEAELARAVVYWKLTAGPRVQYGYDHFTLVKQDGEWKIANLIFYGVKTPEE